MYTRDHNLYPFFIWAKVIEGQTWLSLMNDTGGLWRGRSLLFVTLCSSELFICVYNSHSNMCEVISPMAFFFKLLIYYVLPRSCITFIL